MFAIISIRRIVEFFLVRGLGKPQKSFFPSPLRGGGGKGCPLRKKDFFFSFVIVLLTTKPRGGGGLQAVVNGPPKKIFFFRLPFTNISKVCKRDHQQFSLLSTKQMVDFTHPQI